MIRVKTAQEIGYLRQGGKHLAEVLQEVARAVAPGVSTKELDAITEREIRARGDTPAFLQYRPVGAPGPFPASLCIAPNDTVVHGIPTVEPYVLKEGDIIGIDTGLVHEGMIVDAGLTVPVGKITKEAQKLLDVTREALAIGIKAVKIGGRVGDIGAAIEEFVRPHGYAIVEELCGHGVGHKVHEEPNVPNFGRKGTGVELVAGMVLAIEPMLNMGSRHVVFQPDGYTVKTRDGNLSAHFEHTIALTEQGVEILTKL